MTGEDHEDWIEGNTRLFSAIDGFITRAREQGWSRAFTAGYSEGMCFAQDPVAVTAARAIFATLWPPERP